MNAFDNTLGTILCRANVETINSIVGACGLRVLERPDPFHYDVVSGGRSMLQDAVVERDLLAMAFTNLREAHDRGDLPPFSFTSAHQLGLASNELMCD